MRSSMDDLADPTLVAFAESLRAEVPVRDEWRRDVLAAVAADERAYATRPITNGNGKAPWLALGRLQAVCAGALLLLLGAAGATMILTLLADGCLLR